jgi:hypothetical protein
LHPFKYILKILQQSPTIFKIYVNSLFLKSIILCVTPLTLREIGFFQFKVPLRSKKSVK